MCCSLSMKNRDIGLIRVGSKCEWEWMVFVEAQVASVGPVECHCEFPD